MIIGILVIYWTKDGTAGVIFSISGILTATAGVIACHIVKRITTVEYLTTAAIGAITGPGGTIFIILIVFIMSVLQKISGNETTETKDRFFRHFAENEEIIPCTDRPFRISTAEMNWFLKMENGISNPEESDDENDMIGVSRQKILPWGTKLALATLAILISGVFI